MSIIDWFRRDRKKSHGGKGGTMAVHAMIDPTCPEKLKRTLHDPMDPETQTWTWCPSCIKTVEDMKKYGRTIRVYV